MLPTFSQLQCYSIYIDRFYRNNSISKCEGDLFAVANWRGKCDASIATNVALSRRASITRNFLIGAVARFSFKKPSYKILTNPCVVHGSSDQWCRAIRKSLANIDAMLSGSYLVYFTSNVYYLRLLSFLDCSRKHHCQSHFDELKLCYCKRPSVNACARRTRMSRILLLSRSRYSKLIWYLDSHISVIRGNGHCHILLPQNATEASCETIFQHGRAGTGTCRLYDKFPHRSPNLTSPPILHRDLHLRDQRPFVACHSHLIYHFKV